MRRHGGSPVLLSFVLVDELAVLNQLACGVEPPFAVVGVTGDPDLDGLVHIAITRSCCPGSSQLPTLEADVLGSESGNLYAMVRITRIECSEPFSEPFIGIDDLSRQWRFTRAIACQPVVGTRWHALIACGSCSA